MLLKDRFTNYIHELQDSICNSLEELEPSTKFRSDNWQRDGGGGGLTRVIENGEVFEKGGVNTSVVHGELPEPIQKRFNVDNGYFFAAGISLVIHPKSPMIPTVHANYRFFELYDEENGTAVDSWFGGGADLTPYYFYKEDAQHFHKTLKTACDVVDPKLYPDYKKECDEYFYNSHRNESRGIGGIFYDYHRETDQHSLEDWLRLAKSCGNAFIPAYAPIVEKRRNESYTDDQRYWQEIRRGRYVEFNLIHDRGTLFGLKTNGRIESILMSLPPRVRWDYDFHPEKESREEELIHVLQNPQDWIAE